MILSNSVCTCARGLARALVIDAELTKPVRAEAVSTAVYAQNRDPQCGLGGNTSDQWWYNCKPGVSNLKVFGSLALADVPSELQQKLNDKAKEMVLVGYCLMSNVHYLYNPTTVVVHRDVVFNEVGLG